MRALPPASACAGSPGRGLSPAVKARLGRGRLHAGAPPCAAAGVPRCDVCAEEAETEENALLQCDACRVYVRARPPHNLRPKPSKGFMLCV